MVIWLQEQKMNVLHVKDDMEQLSLPFFVDCPVCTPSGDRKKDLLRSMCENHWDEYTKNFDSEGYIIKLREALKKGFEEYRRPRHNMRRDFMKKRI